MSARDTRDARNARNARNATAWASTPEPGLERLLARLLQSGTWLASAVIALGLALTAVPGIQDGRTPAAFSSMHVVTAGIALFILLPVVRVGVMLTVYLRECDYRLAAVAALVLLIIFAGFALGATHMMN